MIPPQTEEIFMMLTNGTGEGDIMKSINNRLSRNLQEFTQLYTNELNNTLNGDLIEGVYLYGSIALGAFNEYKSDIDFIVLLKRPASVQELTSIKEIHTKMNTNHFGNRMDGVYLQANLVGKINEEQPFYPYCEEGIIDVGHWDVNHITWWVLKKHGITLQGRPIEELDIPTNWEDVMKTLNYNINHYWFNKTKEVDNFLSDDMIEFTTTTICRIICSLEKKDIFSKDAAVNECLNILPERWYPLLKEGARIRTESITKSLFFSNRIRAEECRDFILFAHQLCNEKFFVEV